MQVDQHQHLNETTRSMGTMLRHDWLRVLALCVTGVHQLDSLKNCFTTLPEFLSHVGGLELERIPENLTAKHSEQRISIEYIPQIGYASQRFPFVLQCLSKYLVQSL
eukprot:7884269-Pyramimonas_sp.AAC.3